MRILFVVLRFVTAAAIIAAIAAQLVRSIENVTDADGDVGTLLLNFFSFFTIDSNVLAAVTALVGTVVLLRLKAGATEARWFTTMRLLAVTFMTVTLIVYNLLLRGIELPQGQTVEWSNEILHVAGPLLVIADWLFAPGRTRLEWRRMWAVIVFPVVWAAYTLIRGPFALDPVSGAAPWYPYPFLNPATSENGYLSVAFYVLLIAGVFLAIGAGAVWVSRRGATPRVSA